MTRQVDAKKKPTLGDKTEVTEEETNWSFNDDVGVETHDTQNGAAKRALSNNFSSDKAQAQNKAITQESLQGNNRDKSLPCNDGSTTISKQEKADPCNVGVSIRTPDTTGIISQQSFSAPLTNLTVDEENNFEQVTLEI